MADQEPADKTDENPEGVFGNLPATRPGSRSPRRRTSGADTGAERASPTSSAPAKATPTPPPPPKPPPEPPRGTERERAVTPDGGSGPRIASVEDLAWAGIAVAAQAATVGVRFASRALEAARKSIEPPE